MKKQYIIQKYVMAESVAEALELAQTMPIHECYVHNSWFEKANFNFFDESETNGRTGFANDRRFDRMQPPPKKLEL